VPKDDHDEVPDWTVWLRARLERVSSSEGKTADREATALPAPVQVGAGDSGDSGGGTIATSPEVSAPPATADPTADPVTSPASTDTDADPDAETDADTDADTETDQSSASAAKASPPVTAGQPQAVVSSAAGPPPAVAPSVALPDPTLTIALESLRSASMALSARVDALADTTSSFRSVLNERLDEYAETVLRVAKGNASDIEEYRRMHAASITELRRTGTETADSLARLAGRMEELVTTQADDERWAEVLGQLSNNTNSSFRSVLNERLDEYAETVLRVAKGNASDIEEYRRMHAASITELRRTGTETADSLARLAATAEIPQDPVLQLDDAQIQALAAAVAEVLAARIPVTRIRNELRSTPTVPESTRRGSPGPSASDAEVASPGPDRRSAARRPRRTNPIQVRGSDRPPS
jgi:hypothetical protein